MVAIESGTGLEDLAHQLFDVVTRFCQGVPRGRKRAGDLKDIEFLTLSLLNQREPLIVGDLQRQLSVLPAQMSRIIRSLEARDRPLIACRINATDKRKIDVILTAAGRSAFLEYQTSRVRTISRLLAKLSRDDLGDVTRVLGKLHVALDLRPINEA